MTTISCSSNCIYQKDGNCTLDNVTANQISTTSDCIFFQKKVPKHLPAASPV